mgnify:CR=1 FL=1
MGPGGLTPGSYDPSRLTQEQRNWLWSYFGHGSSPAPVGYGGEQSVQANQPVNVPQAMAYPSQGLSSPSIQSTGDYPVYENYVKAPKEYLTQVKQGELGKQLEEFYTQVLNFAKGDLDLAKRIINYTYESGTREAKTARAAPATTTAPPRPAQHPKAPTSTSRKWPSSCG